MASRRQEKVARVIKESVSDTIQNHLSDPRIEGFISVTKVDMSPDLKNAEIFISIFGSDEKAQTKTFSAIKHAHSKVQSMLSRAVKSKFCPSVHFQLDQQFKKNITTVNLINQAASEYISEEPQTEETNDNDSQ